MSTQTKEMTTMTLNIASVTGLFAMTLLMAAALLTIGTI